MNTMEVASVGILHNASNQLLDRIGTRKLPSVVVLLQGSLTSGGLNRKYVQIYDPDIFGDIYRYKGLHSFVYQAFFQSGLSGRNKTQAWEDLEGTRYELTDSENDVQGNVDEVQESRGKRVRNRQRVDLDDSEL